MNLHVKKATVMIIWHDLLILFLNIPDIPFKYAPHAYING